jgi:hypothetical protein
LGSLLQLLNIYDYQVVEHMVTSWQFELWKNFPPEMESLQAEVVDPS